MLAAFDPGVVTGVAVVDEGGELVLAADVHKDELRSFLDKLDSVTEVIVEDFRLYRSKNRSLTGSDMPAAQAVGVIEAWAGDKHLRVTRRPASMRKALPPRVLDGLKNNRLLRGKKHARDAAMHALAALLSRGVHPYSLALRRRSG